MPWAVQVYIPADKKGVKAGGGGPEKQVAEAIGHGGCYIGNWRKEPSQSGINMNWFKSKRIYKNVKRLHTHILSYR